MMICIGIVVMVCELQGKPAPATDSYCALTRPIYFKSTDDRFTKEQADSHNRKWKRICRDAQK